MTSKAIAAALVTLGLAGCYTLNGISISPETETYWVEQFEVNTIEAPAEIGQQFTELLKVKVNSNTRLAFDEGAPDVLFTGAIVGFSVTPEAPNDQNRSDLSRLTVSVSVEYVDDLTEANSYTRTFSDYELFPADQDLLSVQDELLGVLFERLAEEAFNTAFSNW